MSKPWYVPTKVYAWYARVELDRRAKHNDEVARGAVSAMRKAMNISPEAMAVVDAMNEVKSPAKTYGLPVRLEVPVERYAPPKGVCPATHVLAMDAAMSDAVFNNVVSNFTGMGFVGFPYLIELTQITEYRDMAERTSAEMVRKWIKFRSTSDNDQRGRIKKIDARFRELGVRDIFRRATVCAEQQGGSKIFIDLGKDTGPELATELVIKDYKIRKGGIRNLKLIEPITTYPASYNASNPKAADYYQPSAWFVYGEEVHASRFLQFIPHELPDLLKPAYNFSGISLSQLAIPYVEYWLGTRTSVGRLLKNFSITTFTTDMGDFISGGTGANLFKRLKSFVSFRDNSSVFVMDGAKGEKLEQINTPLSGLDKLQAQAQEHLATVAKTPLVVMFGITPSGLNATAEGDLRVYYSYIADQQETLYRKPLETLLKIVQLDVDGTIDENLTFDFVPLFEMTEKERAVIRKDSAVEAQTLVTIGSVSPEEVRDKYIADEESGWNNLDADNVKGKLTPGVGGKGGAAGGTSEAAEAGAEAGQEENAQDALNLLCNAADSLCMDAALEFGKFFGNQHTGSIGGKDEHPAVTAGKLSALATTASHAARTADSRGAHARALAAHSRALEAHKKALESAQSEQETRVHNAYIEAHDAACAAHQLGMCSASTRHGGGS